MLWSTSTGYTTGTWFELKTVVTSEGDGARIRAYFKPYNGSEEELCNYLDDSPVPQGTVAMYSWCMQDGGGAHFDNVTVENAHPATQGSAIRQTVTVAAGTELSFDWNFLTDQDTPDAAHNDFALVSISPGTISLADTYSVFAPSATSFIEETGFNTFRYTFAEAGTYTVAIAVADAGDPSVDSGLLIDKPDLQPRLPSTDSPA